ncbi:hypothetical protein A2662_01260 [Candidatus Giovannonibacteria bacterium RIFCSPHIGHO2_01_FULL_45_33]|uniref:Uncharacterized protein n=1 Tax=Candidatus Giovannonibacteria bacterium RIFCSPLOWO2_01_FULL_45_34 TaxID=1798351 RepID=A0A1F5WZE7_9BACT|nr:MAG: hypothetical protein A2662_01260 [Candidatus Giovannonibacteria bacterium RIFCSPHIGHO2_01_FULL_45_33]OGF69223.1 MAG: hypothetical protein A3C73_00465 [Candidatus Giovannonibacteria bacterium RIFCSPHIGHO2_02_FULL_44_11]OGF81010.1 MAG: hypothetical protein A2930_00120 [Candidatus Giovannonibacteria bacterium RIFCSPLOWO2_01_FULL_45_34]
MVLAHFAVGLVLGLILNVVVAIVSAILVCFLSFRFLIGEAPGESKFALLVAITGGMIFSWIALAIAHFIF